MKVVEAIKKGKPVLSLEVLPPVRGSELGKVLDPLERLVKYNCSFVNVTNHQRAYKLVQTGAGVVKEATNRRTGTVGVAAAIQYKLGIEAVPHLICGGVDKYELEDLLINLNFLGIKNLYVIRGDPQMGARVFVANEDGFEHADQMVAQIKRMNEGQYLFPVDNAGKSDFCIGIAAYPEKHFEALNMERDLFYLKQKVASGADYIITQMFYDVQKFKEFVNLVRAEGIDIPIIPGIKPIGSHKILMTLPRAFYFDVPKELVHGLFEAGSREEEKTFGLDYVTKMIEELLDFGVPGIHLFTMGSSRLTENLLDRFKGIF